MKSHHQIFRSSAILGSSSRINIVIGIIRVKVLAVLLGPAGVGLMGLYQSIMGIAHTLAGYGVGTGGVRQIAISQGDEKVLILIRRALLWGNFLLGGMGMVLLWFTRESLAELVFHDTIHAVDVGWLGVGVFISLIVSSKMAVLQGMRCIGDIARVNVLSLLVGSLVGVLIIWLRFC